MTSLPENRVVLAVTGASGSVYAERLLTLLLKNNTRTYVVMSETAKKVVCTELAGSFLDWLSTAKQQRRFEECAELHDKFGHLELSRENLSQLRTFDAGDLYAPIASGSEGCTHMVVCPASMGSVARIAHGMSQNLIERAADVALKERLPLVLLPRETPFSSIHLQNLLTLSQAGVHIVPAMPAFYHRPERIEDLVDFVVERLASALRIPGLDTHKTVRWNYRQL